MTDYRFSILLCFILSIAAACTSMDNTAKITIPVPRRLVEPPVLSDTGLPEAIERKALELARSSFVSSNREHKADSLKELARSEILGTDSLDGILLLLDSAIEANPFDMEAHLLGAQALARVSARLGSEIQAVVGRKYVDVLIQKRKGDYLPWIAKGDLDSITKKWTDAADAYEKADLQLQFSTRTFW